MTHFKVERQNWAKMAMFYKFPFSSRSNSTTTRLV